MSTTPARVLVVDDDPDCRLMLAALVARAGYVVDSVADGDMAINTVRARPPDLVLLDAHLPGRDGWSVCSWIKGTHASTPVVMLTAFGSDEARQKSLNAGADEFVTKPFRADQLLELLGNLLAA